MYREKCSAKHTGPAELKERAVMRKRSKKSSPRSVISFLIEVLLAMETGRGIRKRQRELRVVWEPVSSGGILLSYT